MADEQLNPVESLDAEWEKEQAKMVPEQDDSQKEESKEETKEQKDEPKQKEDKSEHAFKEMRAEIAELKKQLEEAKKATTKENDSSTAKEQVVPNEVLKELELTKQELKEIKESMTQRERNTRIEGFNAELNRFASEYGLSDDEARSLIDQMGADGYTIDTITAVPTKSIGKIIKGYAADLVAEKEKQKVLKGKKIFQEDKLAEEPNGSDDPFSADALKKEMREYDRERRPWLYKK